MKTTTVLLFVIVGSLLLIVGAFAIFFACGGEVLFWAKTSFATGGGLIEADETVAKEIAKMDFTFSPNSQLTVHFQGINSVPWGRRSEGMETNSMVHAEIEVTGKSLHAIPSGRQYHGIAGEELQKQLVHEIQSRLPDGAEFQLQVLEGLQNFFQEYPERFRHNNK